MNDNYALWCIDKIKEHYKTPLFLEALEHAETILQQHNETAKWVESFSEDRPFCNNCKSLCPFYVDDYGKYVYVTTNYCPHCGKRMEE